MSFSRTSGLAAAVVAAGVLLTSCTSSSKSPDGTNSPASGSSAASPSSSTTPLPAGAGTVIPAGPGVGSAAPTDTYTAPTTAPYPTPGRDPGTLANQLSVLKSLPGSGSSACATVGSHTNIRSGSIAAGNFQVARRTYTADVDKTEVPQLNLYVIPQHAKGMRLATVSVDPKGSGPTKKVTSKQVEQADQYSYYALVLPIPQPGAYRLTMESGADKGCFDVTFTK